MPEKAGNKSSTRVRNVMDSVSKLGKEIPLTLLSRNQSWRLKIVDSTTSAMDSFDRASAACLQCPVCDQSSQEKGRVRGVPYRACSSCNHLFSERMPSEDFLENYYRQSDSAQVETYVNLLVDEALDRQSEIANRKVQFVIETITEVRKSSKPGSALWVDVGCGTGDALDGARKAGYETLGIETDRTQAIVAEKRGIRVINKFLSISSPPPEEISGAVVVSLFNVLEHVVSPERFLMNFCGNLRRGAVLVIEVPRYPSLSAVFQLAGIHEIHRYANPPEHLNIFSDQSMVILLEKVGFELAGTWTYGSDALEAFVAVGDSLGWTDGFGSGTMPETISKLQTSIDQSNLSDNMIAVARKV